MSSQPMNQRPDSDRPRPFFEAESPDLLRRRLLLITFVFPPAQAAGTLRWQKLSRFVAERGWSLDVVTLDPSFVESSDPSRLADLPSGTRIYGVPMRALRIERIVRAAWAMYRGLRSRNREKQTSAPSSGPATSPNGRDARPGSIGRNDVRWALGSWRGLARAYGAWLDYARYGPWARDAATLALRVVDPGVHDAVITSGPPHMAHEAGRQVSRRTGLPLVVDMRDTWSLAERMPEDIASPLWLKLATRYERRVVAQAAVVVTNTEPCRLAMCRTYPDAQHRLVSVMNGCDDGPVPPSRRGDRFTVAYAGEIYLDRDPRLLFRAAAQVVRELALSPADFGVDLIGGVERYGAVPLIDMAREEGLSGFVSIGPPRPHREALEFLAQANLLVSLPQDNDLAIPGKIFEYMRFDAWLLALATPHSATGLLLRGSGADVVQPDDLERMVEVLRERFLQHRQGIRPTRIASDSRFSRRSQAMTLLDAIAACTARTRERSGITVQ